MKILSKNKKIMSKNKFNAFKAIPKKLYKNTLRN